MDDVESWDGRRLLEGGYRLDTAETKIPVTLHIEFAGNDNGGTGTEISKSQNFSDSWVLVVLFASEILNRGA